MPDSPARREALRKMLVELKPHLEKADELTRKVTQGSLSANAIADRQPLSSQTTKHAQDIIRALLFGNPTILDLEEAERVTSILGADCRRELERRLAEAAAKSADEKAFSIIVRLGEKHPKDSQIQTHIGRALLKKEELDFARLQMLACSVPFLQDKDVADFFLSVLSAKLASHGFWRADPTVMVKVD